MVSNSINNTKQRSTSNFKSLNTKKNHDKLWGNPGSSLGEKQKSGRLNKVKYSLNANENAIKQVEAKEYWQHVLNELKFLLSVGKNHREK